MDTGSIDAIDNSRDAVRAHCDPGWHLGLHKYPTIEVDPMHQFLAPGADDPHPYLADRCLEEHASRGTLSNVQKRVKAVDEVFEEYNKVKRSRQPQKDKQPRQGRPDDPDIEETNRQHKSGWDRSATLRLRN